MKFKVDENLPVEIADLLRSAKHDVTTVHSQRLMGQLTRASSQSVGKKAASWSRWIWISPMSVPIRQKNPRALWYCACVTKTNPTF